MSKLRECDRHGGSFSERQEGWAEGNLIIHRRFEDGSPNDERIPVDYCGPCVRIIRGEKPDNLMPDHYHHEEPARRMLPYDPEYTKQMERQTPFGPEDSPRPGDKILDSRDGSTKTVLQPEPEGTACRCGVPSFGEHYHSAPNRNPEFPVFGQDPVDR